MQLVLAGVNHKSAPLSVREQLAFSPAEVPIFYEKLRDRGIEGFLLSTCNRTEVYALAGHAESGGLALIGLLAETRGLKTEDIRPHFYLKSFDQTIAHLFSVAAGMDSMVPGEDQILGQMRAALDTARHFDSLGPVMHRLGAAALTVGKSVRSDTAICRHPLSLVSLALQAAAKEIGSLAGKSVLVIGAGHTARLAVRHLDGANTQLTICNRTRAHAEALAIDSNSVVTSWSNLDASIRNADLVVSCTHAPDTIVSADMVTRLMAGRPDRPLLLIDLAVPHDIDPNVEAIDGIRLIGMNELERLSAGNREARNGESEKAGLIIAAGVEKFLTWWNSRQVTPTISSMLGYANRVREQETEKVIARLGNLDESQQALVRSLGARIVSQLLHTPMRVLKTHPEGANLGWAVQQLFDLRVVDAVIGPEGGATLTQKEKTAEPDATKCSYETSGRDS